MATSDGSPIVTHKEDQSYDEGSLLDKQFESLEEVERCYQDYGRQNGFCIRRRSSKKGISWLDEITHVLFVCHREGSYVGNVKEDERVKDTSTLKCDCKAHMRVKYVPATKKWVVTTFNDNHNHGCVSPSKRIKLRSNRQMPDNIKNMTEKFHRENIRVSKIVSIYDGENVGFDNRDLYNHLRNKRRDEINGGDAQSMLNFFVDKVASHPQFFYAIQMDESGRLVNFFWVDDRSRASYQYFGDVVSFDTTYRTNKYNMPFAPFTGVNHHMHTIQFGCALLQDETEVSFKWLFETWLKAMGGRAPNAILTDQDLAMKKSIAEVMPNTRHRLCIWHIKKKFVEKLSHVYYKKSKFKKDVKKCIWFTYKKEDFEEQWMRLMNEYGLENNEWLKQLFDIREFWAPVYNRGTFFAGMNTTGRSEGVNSFFDDFVTPQTNLKEFVVKYEQAMKRIVSREMFEDLESEHKCRIVDDDEYLLKHAASVYTRNVFSKFKVQLKETRRFKVEDIINEDEFQSFVVQSKIYDSERFIVSLDLQSREGKCECQNFEFVGIPCKHLLKVFLHKDIDTIPEAFILPRWRLKANIFRKNFEVLVEDNGTEEAKERRITQMSQQGQELVYLAAESDERFRVYTKYQNDLRGILLSIPLNKTSDIKQNDNAEPSQILLSDPNISQTKGRKKDGSLQAVRFKSGLELATSKSKRHCACCKRLAYHDKRTCPKNPESKNYKGITEISESESDD